MSNQSHEDQVKQAELELERDMKIFHDLKSIISASDGRPLKIVAMSAEVEAHIKKFSLKKAGSFQRSDPRVVDEARRLAQKRDNTLLVIRTDSGFDLYNMMEESEIHAGYPESRISTIPSSSPARDKGCLIVIVAVVGLFIVAWIQV
jgi:hypothetical protein